MRAPPSNPFHRRHWFGPMRLFLIALLALNIVAALQARAATHFVPDGVSLEQQLASPWPLKLWTLLTGVAIPRPENHSSPADHRLPYEVRTIPLGSEHLEAWYIPHAAPRGLVLMFAGYAGVKEALLTPASYLYEFGYSSLLVDFRGSGGSSGNNTTLGIREAEDVVAAFAYAAEQWPVQPRLGYGISMGSTALMRAVALYGLEPQALILEGPFDRLLTTVRHRFTAIGVPAFPAAELLLFWGSVQLGANAFAHNPVEYAAQIGCPTLLMHGEQDPWITADEIRSIAGTIPTRPRLLMVPGRGHDMPFVYGAPELWGETVRRFLDEASGT